MAGEDRFRWGRSCLEEKMAGEDRFRWETTGESRSGFKILIGVSMSFCYFFTWSENVPDVLHFCTEGVESAAPSDPYANIAAAST
jgi:hypothetical protein